MQKIKQIKRDKEPKTREEGKKERKKKGREIANYVHQFSKKSKKETHYYYYDAWLSRSYFGTDFCY